MKFKYVGPHDAVDIRDLGVTVERGHTYDFDPETSAGLKGQGDVWEHIPDPKRVRAGKKAAATRENDDGGES